MANVQLPIAEMTAFDLPKVCVVTGQSQDITFRPVKFQWFPKWIAVFAFAPLIYLIMMAVMMRRAKGELPFSEAGWATYRKSKSMTLMSALGMVVLLIAGLALVGNRAPELGLVLIVGAVIQLVVVSVVMAGKVPACQRIEGDQITLKLPNAAAAEQISAHLSGRTTRRATAAA